MNELTLSGLLRVGRSDWAQHGADFLVVWVEGATPEPEMIVNKPENFAAKLEYYSQAYSEDLTMKKAPHIKIVNYGFLTRADLVDYL